MATKKTSKGKQQLSFKMGINDERIPKLLGVFCLFLALYLFIAFSSYLFSWQIDQDRVLQHSLGLLFQGDAEMANWLGRLGAIVSNMFFYWGFGLPSFIFIFVLTIVGLSSIRRIPFRKNVNFLWSSFWLLLFSSVLLEFIFHNSEFPWGGAFGEEVCTWLTNFLGTIGLVILFIFIGIGLITWFINPNFNELTFNGAIKGIKFYFEDLINGRRSFRKKAMQQQSLPLNTLKPQNHSIAGELETTNANAVSDSDAAKIANDKTQTELDEKGQLAFNLDEKKREKPQSLKTGEGELEIETPQENQNSTENPLPSEHSMTIQTENINHGEPYDPTLELSSYENPVLSLLNDYSEEKIEIDRTELEQNKDQIIETLLNYKIEIVKIKATIGPTVTLYEIVPAPGVRISRIKNLEDDIALSLAALGIRIIAPIPGRGTIGIEVPNKNKQTVSLKEVLIHEKFQRAKMDLPNHFQ